MHSIPDAIANRGDAERLARACEAIFGAMSDDPRVRAAYRQWTRRRGLTALVARLRRRAPHPVQDPTQQDLYDYLALSDAFSPEDFQPTSPDRAWIDGFVQRELHLSYRWLSQLVLARFRLWTMEDVGEPPMRIGFQVPPTLQLKPGRRPRHNGRDIARNVGWLYRLDTQAETVPELAREWAVEARRNNDAHSVVDNALKQARAFLDLVVERPR